MEIYTKSLFGKILANEDIDVIESSLATTACFYLKERKLVLPVWKGISDELTRMLIGHEVSHAIHTPADEWISAYKSKNEEDRSYFKHIMNVVEDVRIDRLIMIKYPGIRNDYRPAMLELRKLGFFGDMDDDGCFIDKLNTHLKYNVSGRNNHPFTFSNFELSIIDEACNAETFDDVLVVSEKIFAAYPKQNKWNILSVFGKTLDASDEKYKKELVEESNPIDINGDNEDESDDILDDALEDTFTIPSMKDVDNIIHPCKRLFLQPEDLKIPDRKDAIYMRSVFKRRKAAQNLRERQKKKTGNLDTNRLHHYKTHDNIFINDIINKKEKNHLIVVLVDGSSSMTKSMEFVAQKVFEIYEFCRLEKIKFLCYMFKSAEGTAPNIEKEKGGYHLVEFYKGKSAIEDFNTMIKSAQGSTPLCSSLISMFSILERLKVSFPDKKTSLIVVTDGMCDSTGTQYRNYTHEKYKISVVPEKSSTGGTDSTASFYKMIRDIYDCRVITINLMNSGMEISESKKDVGGVDLHINLDKSCLNNRNSKGYRKILDTFVEVIS